MTGIRSTTLYGTLDLLALRALVAGPLHGLDIRRRIEDLSDEVLKIEEGALYPALHRLERNGLVRAEWGISDRRRRAKFYALTAKGAARLEQETASWLAHIRAVGRVLDEETGVARP